MIILTWLAHLVWLLVRAAILILSYILFALFLFASLLAFAVLAGLSWVISLFTQDPPVIELMNIKFNLFEIEFQYHVWFEIEYIEYFDVEIPVIITELIISNSTIFLLSSDFVFGIDKSINGLATEKSFGNVKSSNTISTLTSNSLVTNLPKTSGDYRPISKSAYVAGFLLGSVLTSIPMWVLTSMKIFKTYATIIMMISIVIALAGALTTTILLLTKSNRDGYDIAYQLGFGIALLQAFGALISTRILHVIPIGWTKYLTALTGISAGGLAFIKIFKEILQNEPYYEELMECLSLPDVIFGSIAITLSAMIAITVLYGVQRKAEPQAEVGFISLMLIFLIVGVINVYYGVTGLQGS